MFQNKWKLTAISLALVIVLLTSCFVILYKSQAAAAKESVLLNVSIDGPAKIAADTPTTYTALVAGAVGTVTYSWSLTPEDNNTRVFIDENKFRLTFTTATEEPYLLEVKAYDADGNFGVASMVVYDPPTFPSTYLGVYGAPYSYMIKADGTGWYYAVNGSTGAVDYSATNQTYIEELTCNAISVSGGIIILNEVEHSTTITYSNKVLIIQSYQGQVKYFSYNTVLTHNVTFSQVITGNYWTIPSSNSFTISIKNTLNGGSYIANVNFQFISNTGYEYENWAISFVNTTSASITTAESNNEITFDEGTYLNATVSGDVVHLAWLQGSTPTYQSYYYVNRIQQEGLNTVAVTKDIYVSCEGSPSAGEIDLVLDLYSSVIFTK